MTNTITVITNLLIVVVYMTVVVAALDDKTFLTSVEKDVILDPRTVSLKQVEQQLASAVAFDEQILKTISQTTAAENNDGAEVVIINETKNPMVVTKGTKMSQKNSQNSNTSNEQPKSTISKKKGKKKKEDHPGVSIVNKPMILNIGQGTTGTRTLADALCSHLKITSAHWTSYCHDDRAAAFDEYIWNSQKNFKASHRRVINVFYKMQYCVEDYNKDKIEECSIEQTLQMFQDLKEAVRDVIKSGGTTALMDTPYTRILPFVIQEITNLTGIPPLLIMTKREPFKWAERRFDEIEHVEILCKSMFDSDLEGGTSIVDGSYDPFDLSSCLAQAFERKDFLPRMFSDVFTSNVRVKEEEMQRLIAEQRKREKQEEEDDEASEIIVTNEDVPVRNHFLRRGGNAPVNKEEEGLPQTTTRKHEKKIVFGEYWKEHVLTKVAKAMDIFQQMYDSKICYQIDLFSLEKELSNRELAIDILNTITHSKDPQCQPQAQRLMEYEHITLQDGPQLRFGEV